MSNTLSIKATKDIDPDSIIVCIPWTMPLVMPDNKRGVCSHCGCYVQHRPHVPRKLAKVCVACATPMIKRDVLSGEFNAVITPDTAKEIDAFFKKGRH